VPIPFGRSCDIKLGMRFCACYWIFIVKEMTRDT
jgi:hypothetical protein